MFFERETAFSARFSFFYYKDNIGLFTYHCQKFIFRNGLDTQSIRLCELTARLFTDQNIIRLFAYGTSAFCTKTFDFGLDTLSCEIHKGTCRNDRQTGNRRFLDLCRLVDIQFVK